MISSSRAAGERACAALLFAVAGLASPVLAAQDDRLDRLATLLGKARKALAEERPAEAIPCLREARRLAPKDAAIRAALVAANQRMALRCEQAGDLARAEDFARAALEAAPRALESSLLLARILANRQRAGEAEELYRAVLQRDPGSALAHSLFAAFLEGEQRRAEAKEHLAEALRLDPASRRDRGKLEALGRDLKVEADFETRRSTHFELRYNPAVEAFGLHAAEVLSVLELIHGDVARELGFAPEESVTVLLYTEEEFAEVNRVGHWATGIFDGRIRIGIRSWRDRRGEATRTLRHEVTHAFLARMAPACPTWIHEGLAQMAEGADVGPARARFRSAGKPPLTAAELRSPRLTEDAAAARRFYDECHVLMDHLLATRGRASVLAAVRSLGPAADGTRPDEDAVLRRHLGGSLEDLLRAWHRAEAPSSSPLR